MTYKEYLQTPEWDAKRKKRLQIDTKCSVCGRPFDLQVHHMTYSNFPNEETTDLITVCRNCHEEIEKKKRYAWAESFDIVNKMIIKRFIIENEKQDYSAGGYKDFCKLDEIKKYLYPYMKERGANLNRLSGISIVQSYFRNKRYAVILDYYEHGWPRAIVKQRTRFSGAMIDKVYQSPDRAKKLLNESEEL